MEPKWEWVDTVFGVIVGVITAVLSMLGWISPKLAKIEERHQELRDDMDEKIEMAHARVTENAQEIARLRAHREDDQRRLKGIDEKLDRILDRIPRTPWPN